MSIKLIIDVNIVLVFSFIYILHKEPMKLSRTRVSEPILNFFDVWKQFLDSQNNFSHQNHLKWWYVVWTKIDLKKSPKHFYLFYHIWNNQNIINQIVILYTKF